LPREAREHIARYYEGIAKTLADRFDVAEAKDLPSADVAVAERVAETLKGVYHSSDTDCAYFPCVLMGVDIEDDAALYRALGVAQDEKATIGGYENDKLLTTYGGPSDEKTTPTLCLLTRLDEGELESVDEYLGKEEQAAYAEATKMLESTGLVIGGVLCGDDEVSKLVFAVAKTSSGLWAGVLSCRIET
jgi:hypothetical protein